MVLPDYSFCDKKYLNLLFRSTLTNFMRMVFFCTPWKYIFSNYNTLDPFHVTGLFLHPLKTKGFLMFPGGVERGQWHEMGQGCFSHYKYILAWKIDKPNNLQRRFFTILGTKNKGHSPSTPLSTKESNILKKICSWKLHVWWRLQRTSRVKGIRQI